MKSKLWLVLLIIPVVALLVIGCGGQEEKAEKPADEQIEETASPFEALKESYLTEAENLMSAWDEKLSGLEDKKNSLPEIARQPLEEPFKAVMDGKTTLDNNYNDLKDAGEDSFAEKKEAFEGSLSNLNSSYESLMEKF
jgi:hypothetical protein